mgnify:CR=1 FL=1
MSRFTSSRGEVQHLFNIQKQVPVWGIVEIELLDGRTIEGLITSFSIGNTAGSAGPLSHYAEVTIQTIDRQTLTIDYLDVKAARNLTKTRLPAYEAAGLAQVVNFP